LKETKEIPFSVPKINNKFITISNDKKRDIESMISWCPLEDKTNLENFCAN
jgi:low affinity Fe/Cu permease